MIKIYTAMACHSCRKTKEQLSIYGLDFEEINLSEVEISTEELLKIFSLTEIGVEDVISKRSYAYKRLNLDVHLNRLSLNELIQTIQENPTLLRRPLILDEKSLQVGFNEDDIRQFLPRATRRIELGQAIDNVRKRESARDIEKQA